jgi:hypothetical protein
MKNIGFTGTRHGMTHVQRRRVDIELERILSPDPHVTGHHGDCVGADMQFHGIVRRYPWSYLVGHLPVNESDRAFCNFDEVRDPLPYMKRNAQIVAAANVMIGAPFEMEEQKRGGTWSTIRMARRALRHRDSTLLELVVVLPDGTVMS